MTKFNPKGKFRNIKGTVANPENSGLRLILNPIDTDVKLDTFLCKVLTKKWGKVRTEAKTWYANRTNFKLGEIQSLLVQSDVWVVNILVLDKNGLDTKAFENAIKKVGALAKYESATVHITEDMFGTTGFEAAATKELIESGINVYVYNEPTVKVAESPITTITGQASK